MGSKRLSEEDFMNIQKETGYKLISPIPRDRPSATRVEWECPAGHRYMAEYSRLRSGHRCAMCHKKGKADYDALAEKYGFEWVGETVPKDVLHKTKWKCGFGHIWETAYNYIVFGTGCHVCSGYKRFSASDYLGAGKNNGMTLVGNIPETGKSKTTWKCNKGHIYLASIRQILKIKCCPFCARRFPRTKNDMRLLATKRGFEWIGTVAPKNSKEKTPWKCKYGHTWLARTSAIRRGTGCPTCFFDGYSGNKHPNWKGGKSDYGEGWTGKLRREIRKRDNYRCQICGCTARQVHHIVPARVAADNWKHRQENLIVLCNRHHKISDLNVRSSIPKLRKLLMLKYGYSYRQMAYRKLIKDIY